MSVKTLFIRIFTIVYPFFSKFPESLLNKSSFARESSEVKFGVAQTTPNIFDHLPTHCGVQGDKKIA